VRFESKGVEGYWNSNSDLVISLEVAAFGVVTIVGEDRPRNHPPPRDLRPVQTPSLWEVDVGSSFGMALALLSFP
jgi:hypothetical protein